MEELQSNSVACISHSTKLKLLLLVQKFAFLYCEKPLWICLTYFFLLIYSVRLGIARSAVRAGTLQSTTWLTVP